MPGSWYQLQRVPAARPPGSLPVPPWFRIAPGTSCRPLRPLSTCKEGKPARAAPGISCPRPDFCGVSAAPPPVFGLLQLLPVRIAAGSPGTSCAGCLLPAAARGFGGNSPDFVRIAADFAFFPLFSDFLPPPPLISRKFARDCSTVSGFMLCGDFMPPAPGCLSCFFPFSPARIAPP